MHLSYCYNNASFTIPFLSEKGKLKVIVWREDERVSQKVKGELALFMGELTTQVFFQNYLPISASFGLKRVI